MNTPRSVWPARFCAVVLAAIALLASAMVRAAPADDAERAKLGQERATIDARYAARLDECHQRFVVASCVEDAKRDRRRGLDALRSRQIALDETQRKERSAARRSELSVNAAEQARREVARASRPAGAGSEPAAHDDEASPASETRRSTGEHAAASKRQSIGTDDRKSDAKAAGAAERAAKEGRSRATFEARQQHAAEHREEVIGKTIERMKDRPAATPLPLPGAIKPAP